MNKRTSKKVRNLNSMIQQLDSVEIEPSDLEQLALQLVLESKEEKTKVDALKLLLEVKKHLSTDKGQEQLLNILKGE